MAGRNAVWHMEIEPGCRGRKILSRSEVGFLYPPFLVWSEQLRKDRAVLPNFSACKQSHQDLCPSSGSVVCFPLQTVGNSGSANGIHQQDKSHKQEVSSEQNVV